MNFREKLLKAKKSREARESEGYQKLETSTIEDEKLKSLQVQMKIPQKIQDANSKALKVQVEDSPKLDRPNILPEESSSGSNFKVDCSSLMIWEQDPNSEVRPNY